ncbi:5-dehydro-2-deoxygluconokinase [Actinophytocola sp. NPDC049390]|uniref:5-dehydro-2-deoxygluconokinase n=1 Tax=Actinophytocola sp. NPDC049390 TaxID=3363894 RepID=UPI00378E38E0
MPTEHDPVELVCLGRVSVDLYGEQVGAGLAATQSFRRYIGGSAGNTVVGAARLGLRAALASQVGMDAFGDYVEEQLRREGVATTALRRDPQRGTGTIALAPHAGGGFPRIFLVEDPAEFAMSPAQLDAELVRGATGLLVGGTYLSRPHLRETTVAAVAAAREAGTRVVFDIDYRPAFWGVVSRSKGEDEDTVRPEVTEGLRVVLPDCDVVVGTVAEFRALGGSRDIAEAVREVRRHTGALLVVKNGPEGCRAYPGDLDAPVVMPGFPVKVLNSVGAGDAFMAGFLRGYLRDEPIETCLRWAGACGAIVVSRLACSDATPSMAELETFLASADRTAGVHEVSPLLDREQAATVTRHRARTDLGVFAMDHRGYFEKLAADAGRAPESISALKDLLLTAFATVSADRPGTGVLVDDRFVGQAQLERLADGGRWLARAVEINGRIPLDFLGDGDPAALVRAWPVETVVKVLVRVSADDDDAVAAVQRDRLRALSRICRSLQRDLLVEILPSPRKQYGPGEVTTLVRDFYAADVVPAWWKLPPQADAAQWHAVADVIRREDPHCRGILVLGGSTSPELIEANFAAAATEPLVVGFAVGRPIFHELSVRWFAGELTDDDLVAGIAAGYTAVLDRWHAATAHREDR